MTPEEHVTGHRRAGRHFLAGGIRSFVREEGEGEAVVCMHGVPVSCYLYRKVLPELAERGLRGVAFDLPGLGLAERPGDFDYSWTGLGRWSAEAIDAIGLDRFHLVVHDIGGPVGFEVAAAMPDRVASLTILNTVTDPETFAHPAVMRPFTVPIVDRLYLSATRDPVFAQLMYLIGVADRSAASSAELIAHRHLLLHGDGGRAFLRIMKGFERTAAKSRLYESVIRSIEHRQVVWGDQDRALSYEPYAQIAGRVADVDDIVRLPAKHFLQEDQAPALADLVAGLVATAGT